MQRLLPLIGLVGFFALWEIAVRLGWIPHNLVPAPSDIPVAWKNEIMGGYWSRGVLGSLSHYLTGLLTGSVLGIVLGGLCGLIPWVESLQSWIVRVLRPIPGLAWIPFAIIWFGLTPVAASFIIAIAVFWINYFAAWAAVQAVDKDLIEVADAFGHGSFFGRLTKVILPGAMPGIFNGLRTGFGQAWLAVVAAELFGIQGVGSRMMQAASLLASDIVIVYMLTMALLYGVTDVLFVTIRNRVLQWQR